MKKEPHRPHANRYSCDNHLLGHRGEEACARFLLSQGWKILERNFNSPYGEVDIICERQGSLWAVEVKTRRSIDQVWMSRTITRRQIIRVHRSLQWYVLDRMSIIPENIGVYLALVDSSEGKIHIYQLSPKG